MRPAVALLIAASAACIAASDTTKLHAAFGNTIVSTYPDGRTAKIWLSPGGAYRGEGRKHDMSSGTWDLKGDKICFHQQRPSIPLFHSFCTEMPDVSVGQSWQGHAPTGETTTVKLVRGHVHQG